MNGQFEWKGGIDMMGSFDEIIAKRDPKTNDEITRHVIKNEPYKDWVSSYVGDGRVVFSKWGNQDIGAYRGREVEDCLLETWIECKGRIDNSEILKQGSYVGIDNFAMSQSLKSK